MSNLNPRYLLSALMMLLLLNACSSYYRAYGYHWVAKSRLPEDQATPVFLPEAAPSISQRFRPVDLPLEEGHKGIDILVPKPTPVLAASDGEVARVELSILYGKQVMVNHGMTAAGYRIQTRYFHLSEQLVRPGDRLRRGQLIGYVGATGLAGLYPHLHFEVYRLNDDTPPVAVKYLDPQGFWVDGVGRVTCFDRAREFAIDPVELTYPVPCRNIAWR